MTHKSDLSKTAVLIRSIKHGAISQSRTMAFTQTVPIDLGSVSSRQGLLHATTPW